VIGREIPRKGKSVIRNPGRGMDGQEGLEKGGQALDRGGEWDPPVSIEENRF